MQSCFKGIRPEHWRVFDNYTWNWREWCLTDWCTRTHNFNLTRKRTTLKMAFGLSAWKRNNIKAMWSEFLVYTGWFNFNFLQFQPISIILKLLKCFSGILAPLWCRNRWCSYLWFWSRSSKVLDVSFGREHKMAYVNKINKDLRRSDVYSSRDASVWGNRSPAAALFDPYARLWSRLLCVR